MISVIQGDVIEVLKDYPDESFTAAFCDPPYGLKFMGKAWDHGVPASPYWAEILRVLKPGAILMAFSGTRTWHRLGVAIEDAGFQLFDTMMWLHGQGFPKSYNVGQAIEKLVTTGKARRPDRDLGGLPRDRWSGSESGRLFADTGGPVAYTTDVGKTWMGYGTSLKPAFEPILLARKPRQATYAQTAMEHHTAALNIDGCRIASAKPYVINTWDDGAKPFGDGAGHPFTGRQQSGRWPANLLLSHTADCVKVGVNKVKQRSGSVSGNEPSHTGDENTACYGKYKRAAFQRHADADGMETVSVWQCSPDCPVAMLDRQSGYSQTRRCDKPSDCGGNTWGGTIQTHRGPRGHTDSGGASRFFKTFEGERFCYCAKANKRERNMGLPEGERNLHTTVKPLALCRYLATLIVPPEEYCDEAQLLVPFAGVMSEVIGAFLAGWRNITAIDIEKEYCEIGQKRIDWWVAKILETGLTDPKAILKTYGKKTTGD